MSFRRLDAHTLVAGQIAPADVPGVVAAGVKIVVNNRPDGEEPGQPSGAEMDAAAQAAGLAYRHIPIAGGFSEAQVKAMAEALEQGPALAFCRSGTRSTYLWALARARQGADADALFRTAAEAGYDITPILSYLRSPR
jgi:uncharacterized protein (TIGR01244 family)